MAPGINRIFVRGLWHRKLPFAIIFCCLRAFASTAALTGPPAKNPCKINERVWCTMRLAKLSFNHSIGFTHTWRFSIFYKIRWFCSSHHSKCLPHENYPDQILYMDGGLCSTWFSFDSVAKSSRISYPSLYADYIVSVRRMDMDRNRPCEIVLLTLGFTDLLHKE